MEYNLKNREPLWCTPCNLYNIIHQLYLKKKESMILFNFPLFLFLLFFKNLNSFYFIKSCGVCILYFNPNPNIVQPLWKTVLCFLKKLKGWFSLLISHVKNSPSVLLKKFFQAPFCWIKLIFWYRRKE